MLKLLSQKKRKERAQRSMQLALEEALSLQGTGLIGFPSGVVELPIFSNGPGSLWFASDQFKDVKTPRFWNAFGIYDPNKSKQAISVEINIPFPNESASVAGFFAENSQTGDVYLMHSGKIGGGKKGVGKTAFLAWSHAKLTTVLDENGNPRDGIIIAKLDQADFSHRIWNFTQIVSKFKSAVGSGELDTQDFRQRVEEYENYAREFSGKKRVQRAGSFDYQSYHGDVVEALYQERIELQKPDESVYNSNLIDLYVKKNGKIIIIYEVKTSAERQTLYTAIGQLMTHALANGSKAKRILVLPDGEEFPDDINTALSIMNIDIRRFSVSGPKKKPKIVLI